MLVSFLQYICTYLMFQPMNSLYHNEDIILNGITKMLLKLCLDATQNVSVITKLFV